MNGRTRALWAVLALATACAQKPKPAPPVQPEGALCAGGAYVEEMRTDDRVNVIGGKLLASAYNRVGEFNNAFLTAAFSVYAQADTLDLGRFEPGVWYPGKGTSIEVNLHTSGKLFSNNFDLSLTLPHNYPSRGNTYCSDGSDWYGRKES